MPIVCNVKAMHASTSFKLLLEEIVNHNISHNFIKGGESGAEPKEEEVLLAGEDSVCHCAVFIYHDKADNS